MDASFLSQEAPIHAGFFAGVFATMPLWEPAAAQRPRDRALRHAPVRGEGGPALRLPSARNA
jgi:hypothetical protein